MNITDPSTELFCKVDDAITDAPRHPQAILSVSEVVTIGILYSAFSTASKASASALAIPGSGTTTATCCPKLPERTRRFRRRHTQQYWTGRFLAQPTLMGIADRYGIALRHRFGTDAAPDKSDARASPITAGLSAASCASS